MDLILLASGAGKRFGGKKLFADIKGRKLYEHMQNIYEKAYRFEKKIIASGEEEILDFYKGRGFITVINKRPELGKSRSIVLALEKLHPVSDNSSGVMFGVCDQPLLKPETVTNIIKAFEKTEKSIVCVRSKSRMGNPCIFSYKWCEELLSLKGEEGGKKIIKGNLDEVLFVDIPDDNELMDIDTKESYSIALSKLD